MILNMWEIFQSIFTPILVAVIAVKLSLRKFRSEKWWEKKAEAYSKIVEALHQLKNYSVQKLHAEYRQIKLTPEKEEELAQQYKIAYRELIKILDVGSFIIGAEAIKILKAYQDRPRLNWDENPFFEVIEHDLKYTEKCLEDFKIAAKKDLGIK